MLSTAADSLMLFKEHSGRTIITSSYSGDGAISHLVCFISDVFRNGLWPHSFAIAPVVRMMIAAS